MNCDKCGTFNAIGSKFCIKCGNNLVVQTVPQQNVIEQPIPSNMQQPSVNGAINNSINYNVPPVQSQLNMSLNYFRYIVYSLIQPINTYKNENSKLTNFKNSFILVLIVAGIATLANFIQTVINTVRVVNYSLFSDPTTTWDFSRMKDIKYLDVIGKNFLIYVGIIFGIAIIFYLGSLIIKKNINFNKILGIVSSSLIPIVLGAFIISPILGLLWNPLSIIFTLISLVYSFIALYEIINGEIMLEKDKKIYFNIICFSIILVAGYFIYVKLFMNQISDLGDMFNFFN